MKSCLAASILQQVYSVYAASADYLPLHVKYVALQATTTAAVAAAAGAMLLLVVTGAMAVVVMATMPTEETTTEETTAAMEALPQATMGTVDGVATLLAVSFSYSLHLWCSFAVLLFHLLHD